jgi:PAS domain S-box-containing protein
LRETTLELLSDLRLDSLLEHIVQRAAKLLNTTAGYLDMVEPGAPYLKPVIGLGALSESLKFPVRRGEYVAGMVWQTGEPVVVEDYDRFPQHVRAFSHCSLHSMISVPLLSGQEVMGVLGVGYDHVIDHSLAQEAVDLLMQFARFAALAIQNARLFAEAERELAERKQAEQALYDVQTSQRALIDAVQDSLFLMTPDGTLTLANEGLARQFGKTVDELTGTNTYDLVSESVADQRRGFVKAVLESGEAMTVEDRRGDVYLESSIYPVKDVQGTIVPFQKPWDKKVG